MNRREDRKQGALESVAAVGPYLGHGLTLTMAVGLFFYLGWIADGRLGTTPVLSILGALVGAVGGFYYLIRHLLGAQGEATDSEEDDETRTRGPARRPK